MTDPQVFALVAVVALLMTTGAGYLYPPTSPYVRKYGWLVIVPVAFLVGMAFTARRRDTDPSEGGADGGAAAGEMTKAIGHAIADHALAASADADVELTERRLAAEVKTDEARQKLADYRTSVETAREIEDAATRRAALIAAVESTR